MVTFPGGRGKPELDRISVVWSSGLGLAWSASEFVNNMPGTAAKASYLKARVQEAI